MKKVNFWPKNTIFIDLDGQNARFSPNYENLLKKMKIKPPAKQN